MPKAKDTRNDATTIRYLARVHYAARLAEDFPTLTISKPIKDVPTRLGYRGAYRAVRAVHVGGVHIGYVCTQPGWGAGYTAHAARNNEDQDGQIEVDSYEHELLVRVASTGSYRVKKFGSAEQAAHAMMARKLGRALQGWAEFTPPLEPAEFMRRHHARKLADVERTEQKRRNYISEAAKDAVTAQELIETTQKRITALRAINVESDEAANAIVWALELAEKELEAHKTALAGNANWQRKLADGTWNR